MNRKGKVPTLMSHTSHCEEIDDKNKQRSEYSSTDEDNELILHKDHPDCHVKFRL